MLDADSDACNMQDITSDRILNRVLSSRYNHGYIVLTLQTVFRNVTAK